jgi:hypothetical protein
MALYDFPADLILADSIYWGTLPMLVGPREKRPARRRDLRAASSP